MGKSVEDYYNRIKLHAKMNRTYHNQKFYSNVLQDNLKTLIDKKIDYLLTDSFLNYITATGTASIPLYRMTLSDYNCISVGIFSC